MLSPAMATMLAVVTTDAAVDHATLQRALATAVTRLVRLPDRRRLPDRPTTRSWCSRTDGPGAVEPSTRSPTCSPRSARRSPSRWHATPRAPPSSPASASSGPRSNDDARGSRPEPSRNSQLVQCSLNGERSVLGPHPLRARCERRRHRSRAGRDLLRRSDGLPRRCRVRARRGRARRRVMDAREIDIDCDLHLAHGEAHVLFTDLSHAYIDENRRTS